MNEQSSRLAGHTDVPAHKIDSIIDALVQIAGRLEELCGQVRNAQSPDSVPQLTANDAEVRVRKALAENVSVGDEAFAVAEIADAISAALSQDGGPPVPEPHIRAALPKLMKQMFGSRLSCSIRRDGRYVRGWRRLAAKG